MSGIKILKFAFALLVCVMLIMLVIQLKVVGDTNNQNANAQFTSSLDEASIADMQKYVGKNIYGSEIKFIIEHNFAQYQLQTLKATESGLPAFEGTSLSDFAKINVAGDPMYVDQSMLFCVKGIYGTNEQLLGLRFEEVRT